MNANVLIVLGFGNGPRAELAQHECTVTGPEARAQKVGRCCRPRVKTQGNDHNLLVHHSCISAYTYDSLMMPFTVVVKYSIP